MRTDKVVSEAPSEEHTLSPNDLYNAELKTNLFFGYSKNQVDALLERAADMLEMLIIRNRQLEQQTKDQQEDLEKFRDMEDSLRSALVSSQRMNENIITSARFQADAMLEEAKLARAQAIFKMEQLPDALRSEINRLMETRDRLRDAIAALLKSHEELLGRIPRAEDTAIEFMREEAKHYFTFPQDEDAQGKKAGQERHDNNTNAPSRPRFLGDMGDNLNNSKPLTESIDTASTATEPPKDSTENNAV